MTLWCSALAGCLFEARTPETPGEEGDLWIVPYEPKDVFVNLDTGFRAVANSNYERSLDEEFEFLPRVQDWPDFVSWDKEDELAFLDRLKGDYPGERTIQFGDENGVFDGLEEVIGEIAKYEGMYIITLGKGDGSPPDIYAGTAEFVIEKGSVGWVLVRWEDIDVYSDEYTTSTYLRKVMN